MSRVSWLLDLLFPPRCAFCRRALGRGENGVCQECERGGIERTGAHAKQSGDFFSLCVSPLYYEDTVRKAILRFKFNGVTAYAGVFGRILAECVTEHLAGRYDLISWIPLSAKRLKKRGYDQAMLLAMSCALELSDVAAETLEKIRDTPAQSGMGGAAERRANIAGAYRVSDPELVAGKRILLIDDIVTTGSTVSECARELRMAGADDVVCATLARRRD